MDSSSSCAKPSDPADWTLLRGWRAGHATCGEILLFRYHRALFRFFERRVTDDDLLLELVQETLLAACEGKDRIPENVEFRWYLFRVARNRLSDHLRRAARIAPADVPESYRDPFKACVARESQWTLLAALQRLPKPLQRIVRLFYWEGLSVRSIAGRLGLSESAAKNRLFRARREIAASLHVGRGSTLDKDESVRSAFDRWIRSAASPDDAATRHE